MVVASAATALGSFSAASSSPGAVVGLGLLPLARQRGGCVFCWDGHFWVLYVTQPRNWRGLVVSRGAEASVYAFETLFHIDAHNKASYFGLCSTCSVLQMLHMFKNVT